jgi:hypothetical protein
MMCDPRWSGGGGRVTAGDEKQVAELLKSVDGIGWRKGAYAKKILVL